MKSAEDFLRELWGFPPAVEPQALPSPAELQRTEWSPAFEQLMRNRLVMGAFRYGRLNAVGKKQWDRAGSIIRRAELYKETGNLEYLVDIANMALLEFEEGRHPQRHWGAIDDGEHTKEVSDEID